MKQQITYLTLAAALIAVPVLAAPGLGNRADADGNGAVTRAEAETAVTARFTKMDANGDGTLDASDHAARKAERQAKRFAAFDADSDGAITRAEWDAGLAERQAKRAEKHAERSADGKPGKRGHRGNHMARMMKADSDGDKAISAAEFSAAAMAHFDRADADKDGQVTAAEKQAAREAMRAMHHKAAPVQHGE